MLTESQAETTVADGEELREELQPEFVFIEESLFEDERGPPVPLVAKVIPPEAVNSSDGGEVNKEIDGPCC